MCTIVHAAGRQLGHVREYQLGADPRSPQAMINSAFNMPCPEVWATVHTQK
jgi:hypothetical protein